MKIKKFIFIFFLLIFFSNNLSNACTVFMVAKGGKVLGPKNQDWDNLKTMMYFQPLSEGKYSLVHVGNLCSGGFCNSSGMNDQGLWYASASLYEAGTAFGERSDIQNYYNKPPWPYELIEKAMKECATVEVIAIFSAYYEQYGMTGHSIIADKQRNSVIIEFDEKDVVFIRNKSNYQVATNFPIADSTNIRWYNCYRYRVAEQMLKSNQEISVDLFSSICDAVSQNDIYPTILSTVHDLVNGDIYVYNYQNYEEVVKINLTEELQKGEYSLDLPELFHQIKLRSPIYDENVDPKIVEFLWYGNAQNYLLYHATDSNFESCQPIEVGPGFMPKKAQFGFISIILVMMFIIGTLIGKKRLKVIVLGLFIIGILISCGEERITSPYHPSTIEHKITLENLQQHTQYYWKVVAIGESGINSESTVHMFRTGL